MESGRYVICCEVCNMNFAAHYARYLTFDADGNLKAWTPKLIDDPKPKRIRCQYCGCLSEKDYGTCEHCGAAL